MLHLIHPSLAQCGRIWYYSEYIVRYRIVLGEKKCPAHMKQLFWHFFAKVKRS